MKVLIVCILILFTAVPQDHEISMMGVKINDPVAILEEVNFQIILQHENTIKYRTENGNDFSVTSRDGKIVFMENDWLGKGVAWQPMITRFRFGETTLKDIRDSLGTNGFTYSDMMDFKTETDLIQFNCFEFDSPNNEVLVAITKVPLTMNVNADNIAKNLVLDALILSDKDYLDEIWGGEKIFDPAYKKIKF